MAITKTTTNIDTLKINYLTQSMYDDAVLNNEVNANELYFVSSAAPSTLIDTVYPVGSSYSTSNGSFNPNTTWGGTWTQLTNGEPTVKILNSLSNSYKCTAANTWEYTGLTFTIPASHKWILLVTPGWASGRPIGIGIHNSTTLTYNFPIYNTENSSGVVWWTTMLNAGTYYMFEKRQQASSSNNTNAIYRIDFDYTTSFNRWHRTA